jgi:hypothetical protein
MRWSRSEHAPVFVQAGQHYRNIKRIVQGSYRGKRYKVIDQDSGKEENNQGFQPPVSSKSDVAKA